MTENNVTLIINEKIDKNKDKNIDEFKKENFPIIKKGESSKEKKKEKRQKKEPVYRNKKERQEEVKNIIMQLSDFNLNPKYEPIKKLYMLFKEYINEDRRIKVNIPFPEINRRIKGLLAISKNEEVTIALINEKF